MVNPSFTYKSPTHLANLNDIRLCEKLCDVTLKVDNKELKAHKVILASNLRYFGSMFLNSFQETEQDVVVMKNIDGSDLEAFVNYAYTGEMLLKKSNALGLLELADYLNEDAIKEACIKFLEIHLDPSDAFRAYIYSDSRKCVPLKNAAKLRIKSNFGICSQSTEYLNLDIKILKDVINGHTFQSLELLFEGLMRWIMHDSENRRDFVNDLLGLININKLADAYLVKYLGRMAVRSDNDFVILKDMILYHHRCTTIEPVTSPVKNSAEVLMLLGNLDGKRFSNFYDFEKNKWSILKEIKDAQGQIYYKCGISHDQLYYIGHNSKKYTLEIFNPTNHQMKILNSSSIFWGLTMCTCDEFVYLCGGRKGNIPIDHFSRYDLRGNAMQTLSPMQTGRYSAGAVFYQGHLYLLGGQDESSPINSVEKYDSATGRWMAFPSMTISRYSHAVAVLDGKLYVCGGHDGLGGINQVEVYDSTKNSWQLIAAMNKKRWEFVVVARERKLWAIGGDKEKTVEVYDPKKNQWQMDEEMSSGLQMQNPAGGLVSASCITDAK